MPTNIRMQSIASDRIAWSIFVSRMLSRTSNRRAALLQPNPGCRNPAQSNCTCRAGWSRNAVIIEPDSTSSV